MYTPHTLDLGYIRPATIAAMIRDMCDYPTENVTAIQKLLDYLESEVGGEFATEYLTDAEVTPEMIERIYA